MRRLVPLSVALLLGFVPALLACLHPPRDYKGTLSATTLEAMVFFREGREDLVLKVNYKLTGDNNLPALAWVIPVPNKPDAYAVTSPGAFADAFDLVEKYRPRVKGPNDNRTPNIAFEKVIVGEYDVNVLKASGPDAAAELNDWLVAKGFHAYPLEGMHYYTERKWTFLAIKVDKDRAAKSLAEVGGLRPLRISFASDKVVLPLKLFAAGGEMGVQATFFTDTPLALPKDLHDLKSAIGTVEITGKPLGKDLTVLVDEVGKGKVGMFPKLYLTRLEGNVNGPNNKLAEWKSDIELEVVKP